MNISKLLFLIPLALLAGCGSTPPPKLNDSDMLEIVHQLSHISTHAPYSDFVVTHKDGSMFKVMYRHPDKGAMGNAVAPDGNVDDVPYEVWFQNHFGHRHFKTEIAQTVGPGHPKYREVSDAWWQSIQAPT